MYLHIYYDAGFKKQLQLANDMLGSFDKFSELVE